ncbi:hypothetical protein E2562_020589 [Oryza meyeriana var. granulata]|uniref:Uncharacterized protein n=1 Tax=Oryza meyeriana var. granulata TaxID=110450 RepID=A0A6G1E0J7_9ORYZ|nr:hypothetical protein E2562_020589 [Oryza meyeriana var. granulata]
MDAGEGQGQKVHHITAASGPDVPIVPVFTMARTSIVGFQPSWEDVVCLFQGSIFFAKPQLAPLT